MQLHPENPGDAQSSEIQRRIQHLAATLDSVTLRQGHVHPDTIKVVNELAIALWRAGEVDAAIGLLDQATSLLDPGHPIRLDALSTLGAILFEQRHLEPASEILREVLESRVRHTGAEHADSLAAKGDLAAVLFELGESEEAASLEREAYDSAREHLGKKHPVTCVLAWHQTLSYERTKDPESARRMIADELAWLLAEPPDRLGGDQSVIRAILVERLNWDAASAC